MKVYKFSFVKSGEAKDVAVFAACREDALAAVESGFGNVRNLTETTDTTETGNGGTVPPNGYGGGRETRGLLRKILKREAKRTAAGRGQENGKT